MDAESKSGLWGSEDGRWGGFFKAGERGGLGLGLGLGVERFVFGDIGDGENGRGRQGRRGELEMLLAPKQNFMVLKSFTVIECLHGHMALSRLLSENVQSLIFPMRDELKSSHQY